MYKNNSFSKKVLTSVLLLSLATSQANALSFGSIFSIFAPKKPKKTIFNDKNIKIALISTLAATICVISAYFLFKSSNKPKPEDLNKKDNKDTEELKKYGLDERFKKVFTFAINEDSDKTLILENKILKRCKKAGRTKDIFRILETNDNISVNMYDNSSHETPLEIACSKNDRATVSFLIFQRAIIRQQDIDATTDKKIKQKLQFLKWLESNNQDKIIDYAYYLESNEDLINEKQPTPLYNACIKNDIKTVKELVANNALIRRKDLKVTEKNKELKEIYDYLLTIKNNKINMVYKTFDNYIKTLEKEPIKI